MGRSFRMNYKNPPKAQTVRRYDGKSVHVKSKNEALFAAYLNHLHGLGVIEKWLYESREFVFTDSKGNRRRGVSCYRPDFWVMYDDPEDGDCHFECKVALVQRDITKFRLMAQQYPGTNLVLVMPNRPRKGKARMMIAEAEKYVTRTIYRSELCRQL